MAQKTPPVPPPQAASRVGWAVKYLTRGATAYGAFVARRPAWQRPPFYGAAIIGTVALVRVAVAIPYGIATLRWWVIPAAAGVVALGSVAGFLAGAVHSILGRPLLRVPILGPYVTGAVDVAAYGAVVVGLLSVTNPDEPVRLADPITLLALGAWVAIVGPIVGHMFFRVGQPRNRVTPDESPPSSA